MNDGSGRRWPMGMNELRSFGATQQTLQEVGPFELWAGGGWSLLFALLPVRVCTLFRMSTLELGSSHTQKEGGQEQQNRHARGPTNKYEVPRVLWVGWLVWCFPGERTRHTRKEDTALIEKQLG